MLAKGRIPLNNDNNTYDKYPQCATLACFTTYDHWNKTKWWLIPNGHTENTFSWELHPGFTPCLREKTFKNTKDSRARPYLDTRLWLLHSLVCTGTAQLVPPTLHPQCSRCGAPPRWWRYPRTHRSLPSAPGSHLRPQSQGMMLDSSLWQGKFCSKL